MKFRSEIVIRELQGLEYQIADVRRLGIALTQAFRDGDLAGSARATGNAGRVFDAIAIATMSVKHQVIPADGLGEPLESLAELAIRAIRMVAMAEVSHLCEAFHRPAALGRGRALFRVPWQNIDDVAAFVYEEFDRINGMWTPYRRGAPASESRVLYRAAIRAAQHAVKALAVDPRLGRFLRDGRARGDWPEVRRGCARIAAAINVNIDAEPDRQLLMVSQPSQLSDVVTRRRP
jgi:hypothetical protein